MPESLVRPDSHKWAPMGWNVARNASWSHISLLWDGCQGYHQSGEGLSIGWVVRNSCKIQSEAMRVNPCTGRECRVSVKGTWIRSPMTVPIWGLRGLLSLTRGSLVCCPESLHIAAKSHLVTGTHRRGLGGLGRKCAWFWGYQLHPYSSYCHTVCFCPVSACYFSNYHLYPCCPICS